MAFASPSNPLATLTATSLTKAHALHRQGLLAEAEALYRHILKAQPGHVDALQLLALIEAQKQRHAKALVLFDQALKQRPDLVSAWVNRGVSLQAVKRPEDAIASYERALALQPGHLTALFNRAVVLQEMNRSIDAVAGFDAVLQVSPQHPAALYSRSVVLQGLGRHPEALAGYDLCLALQPDRVDALLNRSLVLQNQKRSVEALAGYDRVLELDPGHSEALYGSGVALQSLGRHRQASDRYIRARKLQPEDARARWNESLCALLLGDFAAGWAGYEWRFRQAQQVAPIRDFDVPRWQGREELQGMTILLHPEQGLGDTIQFCRYVKGVAARGATVVLEVQPPLKALLADIEGAHSVVAHGEPLPAFDLHCPLLSLPLAFGTDIDSIPEPLPLRARQPQVEAWQRHLGDDTRLRVGVVWSGHAIHTNDVNRSIPLADFGRIVCEGATFCALQPDLRESDRLALQARPEIRFFGDDLRDFTDTAALIEGMDLVITVDTSVAHLAGSMGKPVWVLLPANPDWRWMLERDDSPWYPTARLFRQPAAGDWQPVIDAVREALAGLLEARVR